MLAAQLLRVLPACLQRILDPLFQLGFKLLQRKVPSLSAKVLHAGLHHVGQDIPAD